MQTLFDYQEDECPWYYFDSSYKTLLGACLILFGVFGVLLNGWLFATFIHSHLLIFKSHILVLNLCSASLGRNLLGFPFSGSSAIAKRWLFGPSCCQLFAFLNQFFGVFQMAALFSIVLERYLQARFYRREKSLYFRWYWTLVGVCWLSSVIFATPPLFGYGVYSCDTTGTSCTFLWPSLQAGTRQIGYSIPYVILCGVVPVIAIFYFMGKAIRLERIYYRSEQQREQKRLTKSAHALTVATLALWVPAAVLSGWQWLPLLAYGYRPHVPAALALIAPIAAEAATSIPVLCYLASDERLRAALLGRMRRHYALLHPDKAKQFNREYLLKQQNNDYYTYGM
ncbi:visual pigment-like receptor peropsin isoform X1 [Ostrinia furnacalis]|uniref:visual pigment-like receptor peropsin isoform X1 n=1 Tax=Ostrinia furnacalis TaxID=93504 RepID=UPI001038870D|nr:visual pigment-like receptor peropsin isoform X1 [Ostrinia furnacalis]